jgi:hypothetical protein
VPTPLTLQIVDNASRCMIADPARGAVAAPLVEVGVQGAVVVTEVEFEPNAYLDVTLELKGEPPRKFFAQVTGHEVRGTRLRWMHLDPGEEQRLKGLLVAYARTAAASKDQPAPADGHGTRRVIRPSSSAIVPFGGGAATPPPAEGERKGTRRMVKARAPVEEDSRANPVIIAPTDRFAKLTSDPGSGAHPAVPATAPSEALAPKSAPPAATVPPSAPPTEDAATIAALEREAAAQPSTSASGRSTSVVTKDGRMDIGASIRNKAKTVRASELAARHEKVRVLNMGTIKTLIQDAVEEAAAHLTRALGEAERARLLEEAEEGFKERLKAFELEKADAEQKAKALQDQLHAARELLEQERKRTIKADQFTVSEQGLVEIDDRMAAIVERSVSRGDVGPELELKLREMVAKILDDERDKIREKEMQAQNDKIALLEKKVSRLANSLEETEKQRDEARQIAEIMQKHGLSYEEVKNKYRIGMADDDPNKARKMELMKELVEANRELRRQLGIVLIPIEQTPAAQPAAAPEASTAPEVPPEAPAAPDAAAEADPVPDEAPPADGENPDDAPWQPPTHFPTDDAPDDQDERGVKRIRHYKHSEPPPLAVVGTDSGAAAAVPTDEVAESAPADDGEVAIDPDDAPWAPPAADAAPAESAPASGIKRIAVVRKEPPPLKPKGR